jgi:hemoglobin
MQTAELCNDDEIRELVHAFYGRVRQDSLLGPVFEAHVENWDTHLAKLTDFWSAMLRGTRRFSGTPMPKHIALPDLSAELFERWLMLFREVADTQPNREMAERAMDAAGRVAKSLWYGYQLSHRPDQPVTDLSRLSPRTGTL